MKRFGTSLLNVVQKSDKEANAKTKKFYKEVSNLNSYKTIILRFNKIKESSRWHRWRLIYRTQKLIYYIVVRLQSRVLHTFSV